MGKYRFKALSPQGAIVKGYEYSIDSMEALHNLKRKGLYCIKLYKSEFIGKVFFNKLNLGGNISNKQLALFCSNLYMCLKSSMSIDNALEVCKSQCTSRLLKGIIEASKSTLMKGSTLYESFKGEKCRFPNFFMALVMLGEESGDFVETFKSLSIFYTSLYKIKKKFISIMLYPLLLLFSSILIFLFFIIVILPMLYESIINLSGASSSTLYFYIKLGEFIKQWGMLILVSTTLIVLFWKATSRWKNKYEEKNTWSIFIKIPLLKNVMKYIISLRFCTEISILLERGMNITKALEVMEKNHNEKIYKNILNEITNEIYEGNSLTMAMESKGIFLDEVLKAVAVGEETGCVGETVSGTVEIMKERLERFMESMLSIMPSIIILIISIVIVKVVLSIIYPIMDMAF